MAKIEEEIGRGCDCRDSSNWADKYWGLSDDRSRLSGHGDFKNSAVRPQGLKKKHQSGFLAVGDALQTEDRRRGDGASYVVRRAPRMPIC
jgi:hypothetical protein